MSETGYIKLYRKFFSNELWMKEREFSEAEAWLDLLNLGAYMPSSRSVRGKRIELDVGELVASERFLAARWKWGRTKLRNFLDMLRANHQITTKQTSGETIIKLVKYRLYNEPRTSRQTSGEPQNEPDANQWRTKYKERKEGKGIDSYSAGAREKFDPQKNPPTLEDVLEASKDPSIAMKREDAEYFFDTFTSSGWLDKYGNPITDWTAKLRAFAKAAKTFNKGKNHGNENNGAGRPNRNAGTYNDNDEPAVF